MRNSGRRVGKFLGGGDIATLPGLGLPALKGYKEFWSPGEVVGVGGTGVLPSVNTTFLFKNWMPNKILWVLDKSTLILGVDRVYSHITLLMAKT